MARKIAVVSGGLSEPSTTRLLADRIASAVTTQITARGEAAETEFVELRPLAQDLATTVALGGLPTLAVAEARETIARAEGLIAVSPVFSSSYSGLFKLFFDVLDTSSLVGTPVLIAATAGSERHSLVLDYALRPLFTYLRAVVVPTGIFAATNDFGAGPGGAELSQRIRRAASEFACHIVAERVPLPGFAQREEDRARSSGNNVDGHVVSFTELLKGHDG
ncbi:CE1759 family FMN reductase [Segniliparus rugosus]|uniref:CE1759 family LLM-partnered FMN reductase n=1 Tax=Segniliparus rugosus (strain ATCC BAA-974 / DSM 45345 / CCUG 50838 / CIP 108380 / JCM 13579 / CDC 945) TaxID=679197 RepID=E5XQ74_SEGRC|nr:CE1759 family FMN reductase [Segniliparus rugosus]EFV13507.1 CE1759 family LLM-partnered FMN reductase [Segniliparus rugosus ATCC BAA-974]